MFFNTKIATMLALATSAVALPAIAHAEQFAFERDGSNYVYKTSVVNGRTVITGRTDRSVPFRLVVKGQRVTGTYNDKPIEFSLRDMARTGTEIAALR